MTRPDFKINDIVVFDARMGDYITTVQGVIVSAEFCSDEFHSPTGQIYKSETNRWLYNVWYCGESGTVAYDNIIYSLN